MFKHIVLVIIVSIVAIFFQAQLTHVLHYLILLHNSVAHALASVFSESPTGKIIQETLALILIPVIIVAVISLVYWLVKRSKMPHVTGFLWFVWAILLVAILA